MQPVLSAGKSVTGAKRGKTCKRCQVRENMQTVPNAGKHANGAKRGKKCNRCQARENMQLVPSAENMRGAGIFFWYFLFTPHDRITQDYSAWEYA